MQNKKELILLLFSTLCDSSTNKNDLFSCAEQSELQVKTVQDNEKYIKVWVWALLSLQDTVFVESSEQMKNKHQEEKKDGGEADRDE